MPNLFLHVVGTHKGDSIEHTQQEELGGSSDRRQSKTLIRSTNVDKIVSNRELDCNLSLEWRQMAIENTVSNDF